MSLIPAGMIILALFSWRPTELDDKAGRFSYPIYLAQYPSAMALVVLGITPGFWGVLGVTIGMSALLLGLIDAPIQTLRQKIRKPKVTGRAQSEECAQFVEFATRDKFQWPGIDLDERP